MAEPTPTASDRGDAAQYAPFSGFAIAAILVSVLFAVILIATMIMSIVSKRSSMSFEMLVFAGVGILLSLIARSKIRHSEGTLAGMQLAGVALWICLLGGLGYGAYIYANSLAVEQQSRDAADRFFKKLQEGRIGHAFVDSLEPERRGPADADDPVELEKQFPEFNLFKAFPMTKLFARNGKDVTVTHRGSNSVEQAKSGFVVVHRYELRCPEGIFEVMIALVAAETKKGSKTPWQVISNGSSGTTQLGIKPVELSALAKMSNELEGDVTVFLNQWFTYFRAGETTVAHLMTADIETRTRAINQLEGLMMFAGSTPTFQTMHPSFLPADRAKPRREEMSMPGLLAGGYASMVVPKSIYFDDLYSIGFFRRDEANAPYNSDRIKQIQNYWQEPMMGMAQAKPVGGNGPANMMLTPESMKMIFNDDQIILELSVDLYLGPMSYVDGRIGVALESSELKKMMQDARKAGIEDLSLKSIYSVKDRPYRIVYLKSDFERKKIPTPGGPGGPPGG